MNGGETADEVCPAGVDCESPVQFRTLPHVRWERKLLARATIQIVPKGQRPSRRVAGVVRRALKKIARRGRGDLVEACVQCLCYLSLYHQLGLDTVDVGEERRLLERDWRAFERIIAAGVEMQEALRAIFETDAPELAVSSEDLTPRLASALKRERLHEVWCHIADLVEASKIEQPPRTFVTRHQRSRNHHAIDIAIEAARVFEDLTGECATIRTYCETKEIKGHVAGKSYGPYLDLVRELFCAFGIDASAEHYARIAKDELRRLIPRDKLRIAPLDNSAR